MSNNGPLNDDAAEFLQNMKSKAAQISQELADELSEDEPELQELKVEEEHGDSFKEAVKKMEEEVKTKHKKLKRAEEKLKSLESNLSHYEEHNKKYGREKYVKKLKGDLSDAKRLLEEAKDAQGNIEGLREQAEHTLRQQLQELEEFGNAEESAREITVDAEGNLKQLEKMEDNLISRIESLNE
jgi:chromosome segregation ATPase